MNDVRVEASRCVLPFSPADVIEDIRREKYVQNGEFTGGGTTFQRLIRRTYYSARPYLSQPIRKHLQRMFLERRPVAGFPDWPVDRTVDRLLEKMLALSMRAQGLERIPFIWFWPEGHTSAAIMTHDVENRAGVRSCSALMDLDEKYGIRSSFQLIPENRYTVPRLLLSEIRHRGFEVNIHDLNHDGRLYWTQEEFARRAAKINHYAQELGANGFRAGVLYRNLDWYDAFDFSYDMSVPNVGHLVPQAGGCCTVMPYFVGRILELPLTTTEDYLLFQILGEYSTDLWKLQIQLIQDGHGLISVLTHPDYLDHLRARETYSALLDHLARLQSENGVWIALPGEVNQWWRARSQMTLVQQDGAWLIRGPGSQRARIAYAHLDGDDIHYTVDHGTAQPTRQRVSIQPAASSGDTPEETDVLAPETVSVGDRSSVKNTDRVSQTESPGGSEFGRHFLFAILCLLSGIALAGPLISLVALATHSDYYSHTVVMPLLVAFVIFLKRRTLFASPTRGTRLGIPLVAGALLVFILERWSLPAASPETRLSLAVLALVLFSMGSFALSYGSRAFCKALFPLLLLLLMVPLPPVAMDNFMHVTRVGSAAVASTIFNAFGVPVFRDGFLFILPGLSIEVAKECSGIHSTIALFVLTLLCGYLFLASTWKRVLLLFFVFPIVSLTNGFRIATLTLLTEYVDRSILYSRLHRDGGILFFLLAFALMAGLLRLLAAPHSRNHNSADNMPNRITSGPEDVGIPVR